MATECITKALRDSHQWDFNRVPVPMQGLPETIMATDYPGGFFYNDGAVFQTLNAAVAQSVYSICLGNAAAPVSLLKIGDNQFAAEHTDDSNNTTVVTCNSKGRIKASVFKGTDRARDLPSLPDKEVDLAPLYAVFIGLISQTDMLGESAGEAMTAALDSLKETTGTAGNFEDRISEVFLINNILVGGFEHNEIPCNIDAGGNIDLLGASNIENNLCNGVLICGNPKYIGKNVNLAPGGVSTKTVSIAEAKKMFEPYAAENTWSEEEELLIPDFPDDYPVMPETILLAELITESRKNKALRKPMTNFLWRGITAYGKSTGVKQLAAILNKPLLHITCSSTMDETKFTSEFVPDNSCTKPVQEKGIPDFDEMMMAPESVWRKLTGENREDVSSQEVLAKWTELCVNSGGSGGVRYKLIESPYITALKNGYICEVSEMSRIRDPGVLVSLNDYDQAGALIPMADGTFGRRHPDAIVIYTDNVGYNSCHQIDPSVMRRVDFPIDSYELTDEFIRNRVKYNTGFSDDGQLNSMIKVWRAVIDYCTENGINEGDISVTELEKWVTCVILKGNGFYKDACRACVIAKASPDRETQEEIWVQAALPILETE